jgi:RNA polymerase sigma-70 factor (ECF subfamily)
VLIVEALELADGRTTMRSASLPLDSARRTTHMVPQEVIGAETFEALVSQQGERLIKSLSAIFLDRELAADAAQEAFVQLYLHWDEVIRKGDPEPWLYKVAINRGKDYRRGLARAARLFQRLVDTSGSEASAEDCSSQTEFMSVLSGLPARQRAAAALYYSADFSVAEIATVMGISEGSVSTHLHRARTALKETLESE